MSKTSQAGTVIQKHSCSRAQQRVRASPSWTRSASRQRTQVCFQHTLLVGGKRLRVWMNGHHRWNRISLIKRSCVKGCPLSFSHDHDQWVFMVYLLLWDNFQYLPSSPGQSLCQRLFCCIWSIYQILKERTKTQFWLKKQEIEICWAEGIKQTLTEMRETPGSEDLDEHGAVFALPTLPSLVQSPRITVNQLITHSLCPAGLSATQTQAVQYWTQKTPLLAPVSRSPFPLREFKS